MSEGAMSSWVDVKVMQALSQHSLASLGALFSFKITSSIASWLITDVWLKEFLHVVEQFVLVGLVLYLVVRLGWHLAGASE
jgi:hypothetical protein